MACVNDTSSIGLSIGAGTLTATAKISATIGNQIQVLSDGLYVPGDGWITLPASLSYVSTTGAGDAAVYNCTTSADLTSGLTPGMKVRLVHAATTKYFTVVSVSGSQIALWGSGLYSLSAGAITAPFFSTSDLPKGWPANLLRCTAPPVVAFDGMQIIFVADATRGTDWPAVYVSSEPTYKWHASGPALEAEDNGTDQNTASLSYQDGTSFPSLNAPRGGDYNITWGGMTYNVAGTYTFLGLTVVGGGINEIQSAGQSSLIQTLAKTVRVPGVPLNAVIKVQFKAGDGTAHAMQRYLLVSPIRFI